MDLLPPIEQREQQIHFRCCWLCLSALWRNSARPQKRQGGPRSTWTERAAPLAAVPVSDQARDPAAGSSPLPSSLATATTLPTRDESSRHSSAHVTARWRTNVMQSQCALLARGAGHCYQISSRHDPYTGLFARRRPGRPPNQASASATERQARQLAIRARWRPYLSSTPCPAVDSRHTPTVGSNSGQEAPAASLRPSSSGRLETCPQQNFRLPFTGRLLAPRRRPRATFMKHSAVPGSQPGSFITFCP